LQIQNATCCPEGAQDTLQIKSKYTGQFFRNKQEGTGTMTWFRHPKENLTYTGQWSEGKMHGEGLNTWPDGTSLKGTWFKGQRVGEHTIVSA
jgi:hypothetical protein